MAILELSAKRGYARVSDVAKHLQITTGSASTNLKSLKQKKLVVEDDNKFLSLSETGRKLAEGIVHQREILVQFLQEVLGVDPHQAEIDACKTEHLFSLETTSKMQEFAKRYAKASGKKAA